MKIAEIALQEAAMVGSGKMNLFHQMNKEALFEFLSTKILV